MVYDLILIGKKFAEKKFEEVKVRFSLIFSQFSRVLQLDPSQHNKGRSLDRKTLDYYIVY